MDRGTRVESEVFLLCSSVLFYFYTLYLYLASPLATGRVSVRAQPGQWKSGLSSGSSPLSLSVSYREWSYRGAGHED